jgi:hypothetical protein
MVDSALRKADVIAQKVMPMIGRFTISRLMRFKNRDPYRDWQWLLRKKKGT